MTNTEQCGASLAEARAPYGSNRAVIAAKIAVLVIILIGFIIIEILLFQKNFRVGYRYEQI
ncbi:t-SNARE complex subunit (syntaxin) [Paenibacillus sp. RC254]|uniref:hypothetical protein n=1 Tax=unclassified Paenibacillus TaxID=185978 RepID=UPI0024BAB7F7|nr:MULTISPECIES: hypothetical protein [unclassified Paenibacillus]